jgi:hypothetical protein
MTAQVRAVSSVVDRGASVTRAGAACLRFSTFAGKTSKTTTTA